MQLYNPEARALRGDPSKRTCPTWHGGIAHQPTSYNPVKHIAYGVGTEGCFSQNGQTVPFLGPEGGIDDKNSSKRTYSSDLYYGAITAFDAIDHKVLAKAVTEHRNSFGHAGDGGRRGVYRAAGWLDRRV